MLTKFNGYPKEMCYECRETKEQDYGQLVEIATDKVRFLCDDCVASLPRYSKDERGTVRFTDKCRCGHTREQHNFVVQDEGSFPSSTDACNAYECVTGGGCGTFEQIKFTDGEPVVTDRGIVVLAEDVTPGQIVAGVAR